MRSASVIASTWSCVTKMLVVLRRRCSFWISRRICTRNLASRFESGSSKRNAAGSRTMARPMATRWRWPAGELARPALEERPELEDLRRALDAFLDLRRRHAADAQPIRHVLVHRHVRVERVVLEHHRDVPVLRFHIVHDPVADRRSSRR
jgi:hypothetical protein